MAAHTLASVDGGGVCAPTAAAAVSSAPAAMTMAGSFQFMRSPALFQCEPECDIAGLEGVSGVARIGAVGDDGGAEAVDLVERGVEIRLGGHSAGGSGATGPMRATPLTPSRPAISNSGSH